MDDGAELVSEIHKSLHELIGIMLCGTEDTSTCVFSLLAMATEGALRFPVIAVNDAMTKHLFDNRYGTGQSTLDGIILSLIHISEPTRLDARSRMPSSA